MESKKHKKSLLDVEMFLLENSPLEASEILVAQFGHGFDADS